MFQWHSPPLCNAPWVSASFLLVMNIWVVFSFSLLYIMLQHIVSKLKVQTMNIPWHLNEFVLWQTKLTMAYITDPILFVMKFPLDYLLL